MGTGLTSSSSITTSGYNTIAPSTKNPIFFQNLKNPSKDLWGISDQTANLSFGMTPTIEVQHQQNKGYIEDDEGIAESGL